MTPQDFCYWLQGFIEIAEPKTISEKQLEEIKNHLRLVFNKVSDRQLVPNSLEVPFCSKFPISHGINNPPKNEILVEYNNIPPQSC